MEVDFDNNADAKYVLDVLVDEIDTGDGVVLTLNRAACESFANLFSQLANEDNDTHIHLGYEESEPQGPGLRIVLRENT